MTTTEILPRVSTPSVSILAPHDHAPRPGSRRTIVGMLRRHWVLISVCTAVVAGATAMFTMRLQPIYVATATVRIDEKQRGTPAQDILHLSSGNAVKTEMEMLRSRSLAGVVADSFALQVRMSEPRRVGRDRIFSFLSVARGAEVGDFTLDRAGRTTFALRRLGDKRTITELTTGHRATVGGLTVELAPDAARWRSVRFTVLPFEDTIDSLQALLVVSRRGRDADIIQVQYEGTDPRLVKDVANALVTRFIAARDDARQTETRSTVKFLRGQLDRLSQQLTSAEDDLRSFRERSQIVSLSDQAAAGVRRHSNLEAERSQIDIERAALAKLLENAAAVAKRNPADAAAAYRNLVGFPTLFRDQVTASLLGSLIAAEDRRAELLVRRRPEDPEVKLYTARVAELEERLHGITLIYVSGLTRQVAELDRAISQSEIQLDRIPAKEMTYARLDRNARILDGIYTLFQSRLKEAELAQAVEDPSVRMVDAAALPRVPVRPKPLINLALATLAGLTLGAAAAFAKEYGDRAVHTRDDLQNATGVPVLALIPRAGVPPRWRLLMRFQGEAARNASHLVSARTAHRRPLLAGDTLLEAFYRLDANLSFASREKVSRILVVTSPLAGEGKTTCALHLAATLARRGQRVLLIDADLRRGRIGKTLGMPRQAGLSDILTGGVVPSDAIRAVSIDDANVSVLTAGSRLGATAQLLNSGRGRSLFRQLATDFDVTVVDSPPLNMVADGVLLASVSDGVLIVARAGSTSADALALGMEQLRAVNAPVLGALLNDIDFDREASYDPAYRYYRPEMYQIADS